MPRNDKKSPVINSAQTTSYLAKIKSIFQVLAICQLPFLILKAEMYLSALSCLINPNHFEVRYRPKSFDRNLNKSLFEYSFTKRKEYLF